MNHLWLKYMIHLSYNLSILSNLRSVQRAIILKYYLYLSTQHWAYEIQAMQTNGEHFTGVQVLTLIELTSSWSVTKKPSWLFTTCLENFAWNVWAHQLCNALVWPICESGRVAHTRLPVNKEFSSFELNGRYQITELFQRSIAQM